MAIETFPEKHLSESSYTSREQVKHGILEARKNEILHDLDTYGYITVPAQEEVLGYIPSEIQNKKIGRKLVASPYRYKQEYLLYNPEKVDIRILDTLGEGYKQQRKELGLLGWREFEETLSQYDVTEDNLQELQKKKIISKKPLEDYPNIYPHEKPNIFIKIKSTPEQVLKDLDEKIKHWREFKGQLGWSIGFPGVMTGIVEYFAYNAHVTPQQMLLAGISTAVGSLGFLYAFMWGEEIELFPHKKVKEYEKLKKKVQEQAQKLERKSIEAKYK